MTEAPSAVNRAVKIELEDRARANVRWLGPNDDSSLAPLIAALDAAEVRVIADPEAIHEGDDPRSSRLVGYSGVVMVLGSENRTAPGSYSWGAAEPLVAQGLPVLVVVGGPPASGIDGGAPPEQLFGPIRLVTNDVTEMSWGPEVQRFIDVVLGHEPAKVAYAFLIGRLERDFAHARIALRTAVEREVGLPLIWSDDGTRRASTSAVRATTQDLIQNASLVIADLTLGPENPQHENPSRAHEIGLTLAYGSTPMLCSREPRRYPYFSIGDLQMFFWNDEHELEQLTRRWLKANQAELGRRVLNELPGQWDSDYESRVAPPEFRFDSELAYRWWPKHAVSSRRTVAIAIGAGVAGGLSVLILLAIGRAALDLF